MIHRYLLLCAVTVIPLCSYGQHLISVDFDEVKTKPPTTEKMPPIGKPGHINEEYVCPNIYPNPSRGLVYIEVVAVHLIEELPVSVTVRANNSFKVLFHIQSTSKSLTVDLSDYSPGIYRFYVMINNESFIRKVVVE